MAKTAKAKVARTSISISLDLLKRAKQRACQQRRPLSNYLQVLVARDLDGVEKVERIEQEVAV